MDNVIRAKMNIKNYVLDYIINIIMLPVVLYGCEARTLTLREECRVRVFENWILRQILGPKRNENGDCRRIYNEKLHSL